MSRSNGTGLHTNNLGLSRTLFWSSKGLRNLLTQVDGQETLGQFDSVEFGSQCLENLLPLNMRGQTSARSAANTVLAVKLDVKRVESMTTRREGDANAVVEAAAFGAVCGCFVLRFIEFEADLRKVVEFGDSVAGNLGLHTTFNDGVEESVDVRFLGEVDERLGVFRRLHCE